MKIDCVLGGTGLADAPHRGGGVGVDVGRGVGVGVGLVHAAANMTVKSKTTSGSTNGKRLFTLRSWNRGSAMKSFSICGTIGTIVRAECGARIVQ